MMDLLARKTGASSTNPGLMLNNSKFLRDIQENSQKWKNWIHLLKEVNQLNLMKTNGLSIHKMFDFKVSNQINYN